MAADLTTYPRTRPSAVDHHLAMVRQLEILKRENEELKKEIQRLKWMATAQD